MFSTALEVTTPLISKDELLDRVGGDEELLREIADIFLSEYPALIEEIRSAISERDARKLERSAHTLKGSVANFGAEEATQAAFELEKLGRVACLDQAPDALFALESHFRVLQPELAAILA